MLYNVPVHPLPELKEAYQVTRCTVWRTADSRNILIFVLDGSCSVETDGETVMLQKGDYILIPAAQEYIRRPRENKDCTLFYLHFLTEAPITECSDEDAEQTVKEMLMLDEESFLSGNGLSYNIEPLFLFKSASLGNDNDKIVALLQALRSERAARQYPSGLLSSLYLTQTLAALAKRTVKKQLSSRGSQDSLYPAALSKALTYIRQNYNQKISLEQLCEHSNVSPQHMIRLFKKHLGTTPVKYINHLKVLHAIDILRSSDRSIKEIAYGLGFENPHYFSRLFAKEESLSPSKKRLYIRNFKEDEFQDEKE